MTKSTKTRSATFEDLRDARFRTAEVLGLGGDDEVMKVHYRALSAAQVVEYMDREQDEAVAQSQKYRMAIADLAAALVTEDRQPLATEEQLMELPADTINMLMRTVAGVKAEGPEGNASGEAGGSASPTA